MTEPETGAARRRLFDLSPAPDLSGTRALALAALAIWIVCAIAVSVHDNIMPGFRDTDDATRLVMVRAMLAGKGWYDQEMTRVFPPHGMWMHWSVLLTGGEAAMMALLRGFMSAAQAEYWTRYIWPLLWILPGVAAALALARNLGGRSAVFLAGALMLVDDNAYRQMVPGRLDHHDVQIVMAVIALACATARSDKVRWAVVGGLATALGLAIGLEALLFQALIGASFGVALMREEKARGPAAAYGLALAGGTLALFLIQTPPARWSLSFCDALALNLTAAIIVGGLALALAAALAPRIGAAGRIAVTAIGGALALAVYLGLDPQCVHGPFAAMSPLVRPFWFDRIQEVQPLPKMLHIEPGAAISAAILVVMSMAAAIGLAARGAKRLDQAAFLALAANLAAAAIAWSAWRMFDYVYWFGLPVIGAALSLIAPRLWRDLMLPGAVVAVLLSPASLGAATQTGLRTFGAHPKLRYVNAGPRCFAGANYRALAALPKGNVLAPQDLGPFILVYTEDSVVAAPYHRVWQAILAAHRVWTAPPAKAEARVRALGADYIVDCPPYPLEAGPKDFGPRLRAGPVPAWLKLVSAPGAALKIYRVLPPAVSGKG